MKTRQNLSKVLSFLLILSIVCSGILYAEKDNLAEQSIISESVQQVGPGTHYKNTKWVTPKGMFNINTVETAIGTEFIKVEVADNGKTTGIATVSKQAGQKAGKDSRVIGAVNGDFFYTNELMGLPSGITIINGEVRTATSNNTVFGVTYNGNCFIDDITMKASANIGKRRYEIAGVNRVRWDNQLILYTPSFNKPTNTKGEGIEVVVKDVDLPILGNREYKGVVEKIHKDVKSIEIPEDRVVLSGQGKAAEFLNTLKEDDEISFNVSFSRGDIEHAISGTPRILKGGQIAEDVKSRGDALTRHPRTAVGIKGGQIVLVTVDGRKKGFSDGMNLYELGEYMLDEGITDALNLDGGGSTTMIVRRQGDLSSNLVNFPSDGRERSVANSIQIISKAPISEPKIIRFMQDSIKIFTNSSYKPSAYALDKYFNRVDIDSNILTYTVSPSLGKVNDDGFFISSSEPGTGEIEGSFNGFSSKMKVKVTDEVATLKIMNDYISLEPGEKEQMSIRAYDEKGKQIIIDPSAVNWLVSGDIGVVDRDGVFTAGKNPKNGQIIAKVSTAIASVPARVGNLPIVLEGFENQNNIEIKSIKAETSSRLSKEDEPVRLGNSSLRFGYNLKSDEVGTSAAYVNFKKPIKVPGKPIEIGLWVHGSGSGNWLRGTYINGNGERKVVNYTKQGGLDWKGWKYVYAEIPKDEKYPISIEQIYVVEPEEENKNQGVIYLDNLYALYKAGEDYYDPEVISVNIENRAELSEKPEEIIIKVRDKGEGIDPESIVLLLDNVQVKSIYNPEKGTIHHTLPARLYKGEHEIWLRLQDKAGNRLNPEFKSYFTILK